jgi:hypothetical protein
MPSNPAFSKSLTFFYICVICVNMSISIHMQCWVLVAHTYNPSYLGSRDQEDHSLRPAQVLKTSSPKITRAKWTGGVA